MADKKGRFTLSGLATYQYRWLALVVIALGLAIVIIDNTVLNVSIPYILRDLHAQYSQIQWAISGYSLTIATVLITIGRLGDMWGRKKIFIAGMLVFGVGSFTGSVAPSVEILIFSRGVVQAIGAAMTLTSALALLTVEFTGRERAIAFGIWGAIAGASASVGPLLGGFLTASLSWRWSLRINVFIVLAALAGTVFLIEHRNNNKQRFDWWGMILSGAGLFCIVFGFIQGRSYGWWRPTGEQVFFGIFRWPLENISVIPWFFLLGFICLVLFVLIERSLERRGQSPLLRLSHFKNKGFSMGLIVLCFLALGQFGIFFSLPIFLENVLGYDSLQAGLTLLFSSGFILVAGIVSGILARKINLKWIIFGGSICLMAGMILLFLLLNIKSSTFELAPAFIIYGFGFGLASSQMNNIIVSSVKREFAGESSATSVMMRQIGASVGIAIIGTALAGTLIANAAVIIKNDPALPSSVRTLMISRLPGIDFEADEFNIPQDIEAATAASLNHDLKQAITMSTRFALIIGLCFVILAAILLFFMPRYDVDT